MISSAQRRPAPVVAAALLAAVLGSGCAATPAAPLPAALSPTPPDEPVFEPAEQGTAEADRRYLNDFSWRDFIALNWPAGDRRGEPDRNKRFGGEADRVVWESWKSRDELFPADPVRSPPTPWDSYDAALGVLRLDGKKQSQFAVADRIPVRDAGKVKLLQQHTRLGEASQSIFPDDPGPPLIAQNKTYVRYETRVNRTAYEFMTRDGHKYYIKENLPMEGFEFDAGSINVKAAWMELPKDRPAVWNRFYHVKAIVIDDWTADGKPVLKECDVGLVGLHIVHKTPGRKDWIWSTFEHVDNLLCEHGGGVPPASFSKLDPAPTDDAKKNVPEPEPLEPGKPYPALDTRIRVEVVRVVAIDPVTQDVNAKYQQHPDVKGTVWENYKLVGTQWPKFGDPTRTSDPGGKASNRLPTRLANVTMETYPLASGRSCLSCHSIAKPAAFVFYPQTHAVSAAGDK